VPAGTGAGARGYADDGDVGYGPKPPQARDTLLDAIAKEPGAGWWRVGAAV